MDTIAHVTGLGDLYDAERRAADRIVADIMATLPPGATLAVTADHGQVDVVDRSLVCRHGSLTPDEMWVPLLAASA